MTIGHNSGATARHSQLRSIVERVEKLEQEKQAIADDIKGVKQEAKSNGFDVKTINAIIRLRKMDAAERAEAEALLEIYMAALGMLGGTPLGDAARRRLAEKPADEQAEAEDDDRAGEQPDETEPPAGETIDAEAVAGARESGGQAHREGKRIVDNPYIAGDPRRAAWDEGWCFEAGSDGMDIPEAFRRRKKDKTRKSDGGDESGSGQPGEGEGA